MFSTRELAWGLVLPALVAAAAVLLLGRGTRARGHLAALVALGAALAQWALLHWEWWPVESWKKTPWVAAASALAVACVPARRPWPIAAALAFLPTAGWMLWKRLAALHGTSGAALAIAALAAVALAWSTIYARASRAWGASALGALFACAAAVSALALFAGSLAIAQLAGAWAAALGAGWAAALVRAPHADLAPALAAVSLPSLAALGATSHLFSSPQYSPWLWALVPLGSLAPALADAGWLGPLSGWRKHALRAALAALPLGAAVALAYASYEASPYG